MVRTKACTWVLASGALAATMLVATAAAAQTTAPDNATRNNPPQVQTEGQSPGENLSDRLDRTGGVIRPKSDVDPAIHATPPDPSAGTMPVIPPPGSPGGDQRIQPK